MAVLHKVALDSGAYLSEADLLESNHYGLICRRFYAPKQKYGSTNLFFALTVVDYENWDVGPLHYSWNSNRRLCPKSS